MLLLFLTSHFSLFCLPVCFRCVNLPLPLPGSCCGTSAQFPASPFALVIKKKNPKTKGGIEVIHSVRKSLRVIWNFSADLCLIRVRKSPTCPPAPKEPSRLISLISSRVEGPFESFELLSSRRSLPPLGGFHFAAAASSPL